MDLFDKENKYRGADLVLNINDYKLLKLVVNNFKMQEHSLYVFYDGGQIASKLVSDGPYKSTYNGGHGMVTYGEHTEGGRCGIEMRIVEDRGIYYECQVMELFEKKNPYVQKFQHEWNKEHLNSDYIDEMLSKENLSKEDCKELLEALETSKTSINLNGPLPRILLIDYLKRRIRMD